jgi:hypothetical protein
MAPVHAWNGDDDNDDDDDNLSSTSDAQQVDDVPVLSTLLLFWLPRGK